MNGIDISFRPVYTVRMAAYKHNADVIRKLEAEISKAGSLRSWAKAHDFSPSFISDALSGRRGVTERLALALGFERAAAWTQTKGE